MLGRGELGLAKPPACEYVDARDRVSARRE
jgi:hypothetical protein